MKRRVYIFLAFLLVLQPILPSFLVLDKATAQESGLIEEANMVDEFGLDEEANMVDVFGLDEEVISGDVLDEEVESLLDEESSAEEEGTQEPTESFDPVMSPSVIKSTEFTVGGKTVEGTGPITVQNNQTAQFKFNLELAAGHKYGPGTTLTYTLPNIFNNIKFPQGTKFGDLGDITTNGNDITITFNDSIQDELGQGTAIEPGSYFFIEATFDNKGDNLNETISLPGQENIQLNFIPLNGSPISKGNGAPYPDAQNSEHIKWTVTVNTDLKASGTVQFKDTLSATGGSGHKFAQDSVVIHELTMKPDGEILGKSNVTENVSRTFNETNTEMTIDLDGTKAYEITYNTIPDDPGNNESVTYQNSANYGTVNAGTKTATVNYGTPLRKEVSSSPSSSNLATEWTIKYNFNKRTISQKNAVLTDSWSTSGGSGTGTQEMSDFNVYEENGTTPADPNEYTMTPAEGGQGFTLQFNQDVTKPYVIKYKTTPKEVFATKDFTVTNTVTRSDTRISKSQSVTYSKKTFMLNKTAGSVNYENKTIQWTIKANQAGYALNEGTKFVDEFKNENMTLKRETVVVKVGGTELVDGTDYELTNNDKKGFIIELKNTTNKEVEISYTTDYDIRDVGSNNRTFENVITINESGLPESPSDSAERTVDSKQKANGKKDGKYNYATKKFEWEVELNFNYNKLTEAIFEDVLPNTQTIDVDSIKVVKGTLNANGEFQPDKDEAGNEIVVNVSDLAPEPNIIRFSLGHISVPHKVTYTSYDTDGVFPETPGKVQITNSATLKDGTTLNASWTKTVGVNYTDKLIMKKGSQLNGTAGIKWNFEFNYAQSNLQNIVITDTVGKDGEGNPNQLIKPDSFKVYEVALSGTSDSASYIVPKQNTLLAKDKYDLNVNIQAGTFELKLPDGNKAYYIEYETIYMGDNDSTVENEVQVNYVSTDGNQASNNFSIKNFKYGNAGTTVKVPFVVVKTDGSTGEPMADVEFTLYSNFQQGVALISKKTDKNGIFDLGMKLTEGDYTLKEAAVAGYDNPGDIKFKLDRNSVAKSGPHEGKQIVEVQNWKTGANSCTNFTLTVKDVDRNLVANKSVTLTNKATGQVLDMSTNKEGEIELNPSAVKAGTYTVTINEGGKEVPLGEVKVAYNGDCKYELQPVPPCDDFTITVNDEKGNARSNVPVTVKDKDGNEIITKTTNSEGKITVDSSILPAGTYDLFEGDLYIGEIEVSYLESCEAKLSPESAPSCPQFTLTVQDRNGKPQENVRVTVKDKDGEIITDGTTDGNGKLFIPKLIKKGLYNVYGENNQFIGSFTVVNTCEAIVKPSSGGGGHVPPPPVDPGKPGTPTEPPVDPEKPGTPTEPPVDPEEPGTPTEPPVDPEEPGTPTEPPVDPEEPGTPTEPPVDPEEPGTPTEPPVDQGGSDSNKQNNKTKPSTEGNATDGNELSKLPQTGEQKYMYMIIFGLLFMIMGGYVLFRKSKYEA